MTNVLLSGELHSRPGARMHGQEEEHQEHVRDRPRGSRQVHPDRLPGGQGRYYRRRQGRRVQGHRYQEGRAGEMHHHQVHVSLISLCGDGIHCDFALSIAFASVTN